jgi:hypothetical protein
MRISDLDGTFWQAGASTVRGVLHRTAKGVRRCALGCLRCAEGMWLQPSGNEHPPPGEGSSERAIVRAEMEEALTDGERIERTEVRRNVTYHIVIGSTLKGRLLAVVRVDHQLGRFSLHARQAGRRAARRYYPVKTADNWVDPFDDMSDEFDAHRDELFSARPAASRSRCAWNRTCWAA